MKRLLAFAMIAAIGMFVIGCGGGQTEPKVKPKPGGGGFQSSTGNQPSTPAPNKK